MGIWRELGDIESTEHSTLAVLRAINHNIVVGFKRIERLLGGSNAVAITFIVNGVLSTQTNGESMSSIKDNDPGATVDAVATDIDGQPVTLASSTWALDATTPLSTITPDATNPMRAVVKPGGDKLADGTLAPLNVSFRGLNADGTPVPPDNADGTPNPAVDVIQVNPSDAVGVAFTVTPGN